MQRLKLEGETLPPEAESGGREGRGEAKSGEKDGERLKVEVEEAREGEAEDRHEVAHCPVVDGLPVVLLPPRRLPINPYRRRSSPLALAASV